MILSIITTPESTENFTCFLPTTSSSGQWCIPCSKTQFYETDIRIPTYISGPNVNGQSVSQAMVSNIDFLPTMLDLAGIEYAVNDYDGMSWVRGGILNASNHSISNYSKIEKWRDRLLIQYGHGGAGSGDADFSKCRTWYPDPDGSFRGKTPNPPSRNPQGKRWMINHHKTNNWRAIRILNESMNAVYAEFVDDYNKLALLNAPNFYEFYDIDLDPHQINNSYSGLDESVKQEFHRMLVEYAVCSGTDCWWTNGNYIDSNITGTSEPEPTSTTTDGKFAEGLEMAEDKEHHSRKSLQICVIAIGVIGICGYLIYRWWKVRTTYVKVP